MANLPPIVASIVGPEGSGKTICGLSFPKPLAVVATDINTEITIRNALDMDDDDEFDPDIIRFLRVSMPTLAFDERDEVQDESERTWEEIRDFLRPMVKDEDERPKSVMFDTATDVYDLRVFAEFGKKDQIAPDVRKNMMGKCNTSYKGIIQAFNNVGVHVALIHRAKEKWVDVEIRTQSGMKEERKRLTGPFDVEREGFKGTGFITSVEINVAFDRAREGKLSAKYGMQISRCNQRPLLIGKEYWGKDPASGVHRATFPFLMAQVFKKTSVEDWQS